MLRYDRQTKPGLVALYDIRPGNGAGPYLQPRNPHGARGITSDDLLGPVGILKCLAHVDCRIFAGVSE